MSTTTNHKRTRIIALVTALLVVAGIFGIMPKAAMASDQTHGDLVVTKKFDGDGLTEDEKATFTITVAFNEGDTTTTLPTQLTVTDKDGKNPKTVPADNKNTFTFELKDGETAKIADANPCKATVKEESIEGFTTTVNATQGNKALDTVKSLPADVTIIANATTNVTVTNTKDTPTPTPTEEKGNLTISKTIEGADTDALKATEFNFKVELKNAEGAEDNGVYNYKIVDTATKKEEGETQQVKSGGSIILKGGKEAQIEAIPANISYTVTEDKEALATGWANTKTEGSTGKIGADATATAAFTNTYTAPTPTPTGTGNLKISKTVSLPKTDEAIKEAEAGSTALERLESRLKQAQGEEFTFVVNLLDASDKPVEGEFEYTGTLAGKDVTGKIKNGGEVTLAHGDSVTITGIPEGTKYTVAENKADNWEVDEASKKGTISSNGAADASFTNTALGALKISKTIKSASGTELSDDLKATDFSFIVTFKENDVDVEGEFAYTGSKEGTIKSGDTITLKGGESVTFPNLKVGMTARVEEVQADYWQASAKALKGEIVEYSARTASFTNTYQDTGSSSGSSVSPSSSSGTTYRTGTTGTTSSRSTTPATSDDTNAVVPVALGAIAVGLVVASRVVRSKE